MQGSATAWVVRNEMGRSLLMTAGHACPDGATFELLARDGSRTVATRLAVSPDADLCALTAPQAGPPMAISRQDLYYDEPVAYVGAPARVFGDGRAPMFRGSYAGGDLITAPAAPGASGSAVFTTQGVVGVLVGIDPRLPGLTYMVPRSDLVKFMESL